MSKKITVVVGKIFSCISSTVDLLGVVAGKMTFDFDFDDTNFRSFQS